jgi:diguanylate cyclase (GGDEF)-like protein
VISLNPVQHRAEKLIDQGGSEHYFQKLSAHGELMIEIPAELQDKLKACRTLPSIPAVALKIMELCEQDDIGTADVASVLARDPALSAKVLKVANSAIYGVRAQVTTLDRAIAIMGTNAVLSLSLSFSLIKTMKKSNRNTFDHMTYWRHSIITALTAKALGNTPEFTNLNEYFLAGLLQDIGILVFNEMVPTAYSRLIPRAERSHEKLVELEREAFGVDHAALGGWLLEHWNLPPNLKVSIAASHNPQIIPPGDAGRLCRVGMVAWRVAEIWINSDTPGATARARQEAIELLGLSPEQFEKLLAEVAGALPEITSSLDLEIGSQEALHRLYDQAREALIVLALQAQQQARLAQDMAKRDGLTALYNRSYLEDALPQFFENAAKANQALSVIFVDVDNFKSINDTHGHQAGDAVLLLIARILQSSTRISDLVARYGGDEFVCILPNSNQDGAAIVADRIRTATASAPHKVSDHSEVEITVSQGCATSLPDSPYDSAISLLKHADRCLYAAKRNGRNRVMSSSSHPAESCAPAPSPGLASGEKLA